MVRPPYWVAARIWSVAATGTGRARIHGAYALNTGKDLDDLEPHLYLYAVEAWLWDHFTSRETADDWLADLDRLPLLIFGHRFEPDFDIRASAMRGTVAAGAALVAKVGGEPIEVDPTAGWSETPTRAVVLFGDGEPLID